MGSLELRQAKGEVELVHRERGGLDAKAVFPKRLALVGPSGTAEAWVTFDRDELYRPESIVFMLDASGSMRGKRLAEAKKAILEATAELHSQSEVAVFVLYDCGWIVHEVRFGDGRERLVEVVDGVEAFGGTPLGEAISQSFEYLHSAAKHPPDHRRLVVLSDGQSGCGVDPIGVVEGWDDDLRAAQGFNIVGIALGAADEAALKRLAEAAGGKIDAGEETDVVERTQRTIRGR
jgi:Ca-activated chloride channel family protein